MYKFQTLLLPSFRQIAINSLRCCATENIQDVAYNEVEKKKRLYKPEHTVEEQISYMKSPEMQRIQQSSEYFSQYIEEYYEEEPEAESEEVYEEKPVAEPIIKRNVSDITMEEVVALLQENRAQNIISINVENERSPWPHVVICSPYNDRHGSALTQTIRKHIKTLYKFEDDIMPRPSIVTNGWFVFDMRTVLLHILSESAREKYELEKLYSSNDENVEDGEVLLPPPSSSTQTSVNAGVTP